LLLKPAIESCIRRAIREGIGMVLEGSHFIPGILEPESPGANLLCVLDVPDRDALKRRALSPNHSRRKLSDKQLDRLIELQEGILSLAEVHHRPVIINNDLPRAVSQARSLIGIQDRGS
jgi:2-phosphoglycerate kinase